MGKRIRTDHAGVDQSVTDGDNTVILIPTTGIVDTDTTLFLVATGAFQAYQQATGATLGRPVVSWWTYHAWAVIVRSATRMRACSLVSEMYCPVQVRNRMALPFPTVHARADS